MAPLQKKRKLAEGQQPLNFSSNKNKKLLPPANSDACPPTSPLKAAADPLPDTTSNATITALLRANNSSTKSAEEPDSTTQQPATSDGAVKASHNRNYQRSWKETYPWVVYDSTKEKVFCGICSKAVEMAVPLPFPSGREKRSLQTFVHEGYSNWKKAIERFKRHEKSDMHRAAAQGVAAVNAGVNVVATMSVGKQKHMADARVALLGILSPGREAVKK